MLREAYASDALIFTLLLLGYFRTVHWPARKRLWYLGPLIPLVMGFSYAAPFMVGTILLALVPKAYSERARGLLPWLLASGVTVATLAVLYYGPIQAQRVPKLVNEWSRYYMNLNNPLQLPGWLAEQTLGVFHYCLLPSGALLVFCMPYAVWVLVKNREYDLLIVLCAPFVLVLAASAMKSYVYGHSRLMIFILPVLVLWCGKAFAAWLERSAVAIVIAVVLVSLCDGLTLYHIAYPWEKPDAQSVTRFVNSRRKPQEPVYSNEDNYLYFFRNDLKRLPEAIDVPLGRRIWVVMDFYHDAERRAYIESQFSPGKFELIESHQFFQAPRISMNAKSSLGPTQVSLAPRKSQNSSQTSDCCRQDIRLSCDKRVNGWHTTYV